MGSTKVLLEISMPAGVFFFFEMFVTRTLFRSYYETQTKL